MNRVLIGLAGIALILLPLLTAGGRDMAAAFPRLLVLWLPGAALATLALGETRPVCVCGKRSHPTREDAEAHRAALVALKLERTDRPRFSLLRKVGPLYTYYCARALGGAYHVGHRIGAR